MHTLELGHAEPDESKSRTSRYLKYRRDVDGLRAVAVVAVVIYHARFVVGDDILLSGGYVGVDVFFVISGFLITTLIARELDDRRFSIRRFYERRIRRIMPALLFLLALAVPFGYLVLDPTALDEFAGSVPAALLFFANVFFFAQDSYAAEPSQLKPLLHTWSLSVEEQFYLFFPPLMMLLWRVDRRVRGLALGGLFVASLALAQVLATRNSDANFFLIPTRVWELLAGSVLALYGPRWRSIIGDRGRWLPTAGLTAIAVACVVFDESTRHPSVTTLLPILGSVAVIGFPYDRSIATRALSSRSLVGIGLISYSLYLWHFTIFAFGRVTSDGQVGVFERCVWIAASFVMAGISWRFVERPFRQPGLISTRSVVAIVGAISVALGSITAITARGDADSAYSTIPVEVLATFNDWSDPYSDLPTCIDQERFLDPSTWCRLGVAGAPDFLVVGDSHALAQAAVFDAGAALTDRTGLLVSRSGCPVLAGFEPQRGAPLSQQCLELAERVQSYVAERSISQVFLTSRWNYYTCGEPSDGCGFTQNARYRDEPFGASADDRLRYLGQAMDETVSRLRAVDAEVSLLAQVPHHPDDPRAIFDDAFAAGDLTVVDRDAVSRDAHLAFTSDVRALLDQVAARYDRTAVLDQAIVLCDDAGTCRIGADGRSWYSDDNHLSVGAADPLASWAAGALGIG